MFEKAKPIRTYQAVAEQIQEAILSGKIKPGERLSAERNLSKEFDISRRTLREAFRVLENKGLIEIRTGMKGGAVVRDLNTEQMAESLAMLIRSGKASLPNLTAFRWDLETAVASRAAAEATEKDIAMLEGLLGEGEALLSKKNFDWKAFLDVDRRMHIAVATVARNPIHEFILTSIHENILRYYENYLPKDKKVSKLNYKDMFDLVQAIKQGDESLASEKAREHVRHGWSFMKKHLNKNQA
jgi:GntR family transcriptional regulator, transcriptional repressor for pyruvate dehydrogenase complex